MIEANKDNPKIYKELKEEKRDFELTEAVNQSIMNDCFRRYMLAFSIIQETSQPDFYEKFNIPEWVDIFTRTHLQLSSLSRIIDYIFCIYYIKCNNSY